MRPVDPALVRAVQRNTPGAMDELIRATYGDVYSLARRLMGNPEDAADATQEVFIRVVRGVLAFRAEAAFSTWLHTVTVNVCLSALRKRSKLSQTGASAGWKPFATPDDVTAIDLESSEDVEDTVASSIDNAALARRTAEALDQLSDEARAVVVLRDIQELSTKEVAAMLDVSESVVKVRLHRAHARLRELMGDAR